MNNYLSTVPTHASAGSGSVVVASYMADVEVDQMVELMTSHPAVDTGARGMYGLYTCAPIPSHIVVTRPDKNPA